MMQFERATATGLRKRQAGGAPEADQVVRPCLCPVFPPPSWPRHCLCPVFPPPSWPRPCLCPVLPPPSWPRPCLFPVLYCLWLCLVLPPPSCRSDTPSSHSSHCVSTVFVAKTLHALAPSRRVAQSRGLGRQYLPLPPPHDPCCSPLIVSRPPLLLPVLCLPPALSSVSDYS